MSEAELSSFQENSKKSQEAEKITEDNEKRKHMLDNRMDTYDEGKGDFRTNLRLFVQNKS